MQHADDRRQMEDEPVGMDLGKQSGTVAEHVDLDLPERKVSGSCCAEVLARERAQVLGLEADHRGSWELHASLDEQQN